MEGGTQAWAQACVGSCFSHSRLDRWDASRSRPFCSADAASALTTSMMDIICLKSSSSNCGFLWLSQPLPGNATMSRNNTQQHAATCQKQEWMNQQELTYQSLFPLSQYLVFLFFFFSFHTAIGSHKRHDSESTRRSTNRASWRSAADPALRSFLRAQPTLSFFQAKLHIFSSSCGFHKTQPNCWGVAASNAHPTPVWTPVKTAVYWAFVSRVSAGVLRCGHAVGKRWAARPSPSEPHSEPI